MTSHHPDGVAFEQKIQPVPSSDKMALDLDINGNTNRDETIMNDAPTDLPLNDPVPSPFPADNIAALEIPEVNGASNVDAFSSNQTIAGPLSNAAESQATETSSISAQEIPSSNTTTEDQLPASTDLAQQDLPVPLAPTDSAIDAAIEDASASTTVPLVIEAPESDLRNTSPPPVPEQSEQPGQPADLDLDSAQLPTPQPEKETDVVGVSAEVADLTFNQNEAAPEDSLDLGTNSPPAPIAERESSMHIEQATPPQAVQEPNGTDSVDTPQPPTSAKIAREREDDDEIEPSAKRAKTETEDALSDMAPPTQNGDMEGVEFESAGSPLTQYQIKELLKIVKAAARSQNGKNFRAPVAELWPNFAEAYGAKIAKEVDLKTMEKTLNSGGYTSMDAVKADVRLIYDNAVTFNGVDHMISNSALEVRNVILSKIDNMPAEPIPAPKKDKKAKKSTPVPDARDRRVSKGSHPAPNNVAAAPQTFAVDPITNTPLIRRDSTKGDGGRPKREIHPPKSKDLVYAASRPKNKKFATELKFCEEVLTEVMKQKYWAMNHPFTVPVDPVALGIPNYFAIIKKPMDLGTMLSKLKGGQYGNASDFEKDMRQIFANCYKFNPAGNPVHEVGKQFENLFNEEWEKKESYLAEHSPAAASPSLPESDDEEEEEEEEEVQNHNKHSLSAAKELLLEHQQKLITLMSAKNKDEFIISMQQDLVETVKKRVHEEEEAAKKKTKKPKISKAPKKVAPAPKKSGAPKKATTHRPKYMGTLEKETISAGLMNLPDDVSMQVLEDIKRERPGLDAEDDGTLELDIDSISQHLLWKIHGLIMKHAPEVEEAIRKTIQNRESPKAAAKPPPKKKNKPMSSVDQERNIKVLEQKLGNYRASSGSHSQEPVLPTVEDESSGDESSGSEEE
ncbi:hypothetical protein BKA65DRAFT_525384 [Rhexocercosporidium sp. MPI-PUGE-AT-0058]|nr:hypothetical protein BKA65DRAFT_525384 [Rhexocercosporidium sp. MPI-PUGE-AT-0058]